jgi:hypothetical protein
MKVLLCNPIRINGFDVKHLTESFANAVGFVEQHDTVSFAIEGGAYDSPRMISKLTILYVNVLKSVYVPFVKTSNKPLIIAKDIRGNVQNVAVSFVFALKVEKVVASARTVIFTISNRVTIVLAIAESGNSRISVEVSEGGTKGINIAPNVRFDVIVIVQPTDVVLVVKRTDNSTMAFVRISTSSNWLQTLKEARVYFTDNPFLVSRDDDKLLMI